MVDPESELKGQSGCSLFTRVFKVEESTTFHCWMRNYAFGKIYKRLLLFLKLMTTDNVAISIAQIKEGLR